ncbi:hypothetical protein CEXT_374571 [Caerostris extrusa]|uniref:Uncharacterized protein n=1 Tax=Caerostris extrusa TaxID=172846 RepID=A0AAV4MZC7_CAEEX|nr:hypothetical protein CEXT_374571 [Caerostris extrusa]
MDMSMKNRDKLSDETLVIKREKEIIRSCVKEKKKVASPIVQQDAANERKIEGEGKAPTQKKRIPSRISSSSKTNVPKQTNEDHLFAKTKSHRKKRSPSSNRQNSNENLSSDKKSTARKSNSKTSHSATSKEQSPLSTSFTSGYPYTSKLSIILLNRPVLLNCTRNLVGKSKEILMCTSDSIEEVVQNENDLRDDQIVQRLLAKSKPYREQFTPSAPLSSQAPLVEREIQGQDQKKSEHKSRLLGKPNSSCKNQEENEKNRGWQSGRSHPSDEGSEKKLVIRTSSTSTRCSGAPQVRFCDHQVQQLPVAERSWSGSGSEEPRDCERTLQGHRRVGALFKQSTPYCEEWEAAQYDSSLTMPPQRKRARQKERECRIDSSILLTEAEETDRYFTTSARECSMFCSLDLRTSSSDVG